MLYAGVGLLQDGKMKPAVPALNIADGSEAWRVVMDSGSGHGGVRSVVVDGNGHWVHGCFGFRVPVRC